MNWLAARFFWLAHLLSIIYSLTGWLLAPPYLYIHPIFIVLTKLQWDLFGFCILTEMQQKFMPERDSENPLHYTGELLRKLGLDWTNEEVDIILTRGIFLLLLISITRIAIINV